MVFKTHSTAEYKNGVKMKALMRRLKFLFRWDMMGMNRNTGNKEWEEGSCGKKWGGDVGAVEIAHAKPYSGQELAVFQETKASTIDKTSTLKKKSFSTVRATQNGSQHYMEKRLSRRSMFRISHFSFWGMVWVLRVLCPAGTAIYLVLTTQSC